MLTDDLLFFFEKCLFVFPFRVNLLVDHSILESTDIEVPISDWISFEDFHPKTKNRNLLNDGMIQIRPIFFLLVIFHLSEKL